MKKTLRPYSLLLFSLLLCLGCLLWPASHVALAQRLIVETETAEFIDYRLENPQLHRSPFYEWLIPYARGSASYKLLDVRYKIVSMADDSSEVVQIRAGSAETEQPLLETYNQGTYQKQPHAALRIHLTRPLRTGARDQTTALARPEFLVVEQARIRVYKAEALTGVEAQQVFANTSPLSSGIWFKIPITRSGVYRIDRTYLSNLSGINLSTLDPRRLQIWAGQFAMLPMVNNQSRPEFRQLPLMVSGENDGRFDTDDHILFYAEGPQRVFYDAGRQRFVHETHLYSNSTFVFITVGTENGLRLSASPSGSSTQVLTRYTDFLFKEEEKNKIAVEMRSGSEWLGERVTAESFGNTLTMLDSVVVGYVPGSTLTLEALLATRNRLDAKFDTYLGNQLVGSVSLPGLYFEYNAEESAFGYAQEQNVSLNAPNLTNNRLQITSRYSSVSTGDAFGYLDYTRVYVQRDLTAVNGRMWIYNPLQTTGGSGWLTYRMGGFTSQPMVLEVTNPQQPQWYTATSAGSQWDVVVPSGSQRRFIATTTYQSPGAAQAVPNQQLRAISDYPNYVLVIPDAPAYLPIAQELANFRKSNDNLRPAIVTVSQIYNEYSGGVPDVAAIRDFVRHLYLKAGANPSLFPNHLLLFGNATHDYRGIYGTDLSEKNLVFTYESRDSFNRLFSFGSDDFFGLLDENEGEWSLNTVTELVDIGVGRLPFNSATEANTLVRKLKTYEDPSTFGDWRTLFTFAADDDFPDEYRNRDLHILNADSTAEFINRDVSGVRLRKIYEMNYPVESTSGARFRPAANADFIQSFNEGSLVINYSGHGAEQTLSDSRLFQSSDIQRLTNRDKLSIFVTATCSFGRFDDHLDQSGAEKAMTWADGGTIASFTTTRVVFTSEDPNTVNFGLNRRLTGFMTERDAQQLPYRLGEIMKRTKNVTQNSLGGSFNTRKFILLGDPAMRIGLPRQKVDFTRLQNQQLNPQQVSTLKALDKVSVEGNVTQADGSVNTSFNGELTLKVYDGIRVVKLPQRIWMDSTPCFTRNCAYREQNDLLFNGRVSVKNGRFATQFIVPKDIAYSPNPARMFIYGQSDKIDVVGSYSSLVFNGINTTTQNDNKGPSIKAYLDAPEFTNGAMVGSNPTLNVELTDETGINTTGTGVGHEITAILNTQPEQTFVLNEYFEFNLDDYRSGKISFPLDDLEEGEYTLTVRAWDVFNNPTEEKITFKVADAEDIQLRNVLNYPNPMSLRTRFMFEHNQPGNQLDINIRIYTLSGKPVAHLAETRVFPTSQGSVEWLGFDNDNDRLATGTYLYVLKVTAETSKGRRSREVIEKLVVIR